MNTTTADYEPVQLEELLEDIRLDQEVGDQVESAQAEFAPRVQPSMIVQTVYEVPPLPRSRVLSRLLAMADSYLRSDSLHQALEMYFELVRSHPGTPEALLAEERILEVAQRHEFVGELHSARAIYEQLA